MNANKILNDDMTLDEKLAAIDAMLAAPVKPIPKGSMTNLGPIDPSEALMCEGCQ